MATIKVKINGEWMEVPTFAITTIEEAPKDGKEYLRSDGKWVESKVVGGVGTKGYVTNGSSVTDTAGYSPCPIVGGVPYYKEAKLMCVTGTSDDDAYVNIGSIIIPDPPEGHENIIVSIMYYDTSLGFWCPCVSYKSAGNSIHLITGGPSYGVAVVVGGTDCYRCKNAQWRCYYIQQPI